MKIIFTKLPKEGEIKVSFDGGLTFTDYNISDVAESGIQLDDNQDLREIKIKSRTTVLSNLEVITGIKVEQASNTSNGNFTYDLSKSTTYPECITNVIIPEGVISIDTNAFYNRTGLISVTIPEGVISIGTNAFYGCKSLTSINIPEGVKSIASGAFYGCTSLTSINIPDSVTTLDSHVFYSCSSLESITISEGVKSIASSAFYGCKSLTSINIPDSVTDIGNQTFSACSALTNITIPDSVTSIGTQAFRNCPSLTTINYTGTEEQWNTISKGQQWNYGCPSDLVINYNYQG